MERSKDKRTDRPGPEQTREPTVWLTIDITAGIAVRDVWPDGDAPENPTEADVWAAIRDSLGMREGEDVGTYQIERLIHEWNLGANAVLDVEVRS